MAATLGESFIEVGAFEQEAVQRFREVEIKFASAPPTGAVKFPDSAGAFHYADGGDKMHSITSNRFISWSTSGDAVQLVEHSLNGNLLNNAVRLRFGNCQVVPGGVAMVETLNNVVLLVATNQSVHRMLLPHPKPVYRNDAVTELHIQSVLTDVIKLNLDDSCCSAAIPAPLTPAGGAAGVSAVWLTQHGDANYALASPAGGVVVVTQPAKARQGECFVSELKTSWVMRRLSGWIPSAMRGEQSDDVASLAVRELDDDSLVLAVCQDHKLRMWSFRDQTCVLETDMLGYMPVAWKGGGRWSGAGHRLRLTSCSASGLCLAVYLAVPHRRQFVVLQLLPADTNRYSVERISLLFCTQETLVDFVLTSADIWALWLDDNDNAVVKCINFEHNVSGQWNQVFVQPRPEEEVLIGMDQDPRETYLDVIFSPLRFTAAAIVKALQIFRRGADILPDASWEGLRKEVTLAVENKLQSSVTEFEFSQDEYRHLQVEFWSKFYACCLQYQEVLATPLAISVSPHSHMACLIKKGFLSFLLPCFAVDQLYLSSDDQFLTEDDMPFVDEADKAALMSCLHVLRDGVSLEMAHDMESALQHGESPERSAKLVLEKMLAQDNMIEDIQNKLQDVCNLTAAVLGLLKEVDLETDLDFGDGPLFPGESMSVRVSASQLYSSTTAVSLMCQALSHVSATRTLLCRDVLLLLKLCLWLGEHVLPGGASQLLRIQYELIPLASQLLSSYFVLKHFSRSAGVQVADDAVDANLQHLSALHLSDAPALTGSTAAASHQSAVEMFYQSCGHKLAIRHLFSRMADGIAVTWNDSMAIILQALAQLLWPSNSTFHFPECLMANCQYTHLQDYVRLIGSWCQVNVGSSRFMLAQCYLANGEGHKALRCFQEAASEVEKEDFLMKLSGVEDERAAACSPTLRYYNKVLRLLEDVGLPELVIQLATLALAEAVYDVSSQAALWTRIFKHHLDLGHNNEAYEALVQNPDSSMQLDCLRQLVVVLCERAQLHDLVHFSYVNLHDEVVGIIESRARGVDLLTHNYYELLYAFHINRHNYRKAGTVMLELAMRLGREVCSVRGLKKQVNCFLAAINCLRLIRPEYAWMVLPVPESERPGASPKRNSDGDVVSPPVKRQVHILELRDLEKEFMIATCRLALAQHHPQAATVAGGAGPHELVRLLLDAGLFMCARQLCNVFKLPLAPLFDALTFRCIKLQFGGEEAQNEAWLWLAANQLSSVVNTKESSAVDEAWRLLFWFLSEFPSSDGLHHRQVLVKLLSHGVPPPDWLVKFYKEVNAAALLRVFLNFDLLDEAAELVIEYIDALLGRGHQYFGIKTPLSARNPSVWLPYTPIDQLMAALKDTRSKQGLYERLVDKLADYHKMVAKATRIMLATR
ncbi:nuclear pore complex protein Nup160-like [Syngnathus typhle]|uniref:nuclear pore complex protein Nup160-like n=1 Tax=Syngnathus typhle TaxID=161592 RepID=UPI002A6A704C|nr:nuclear pore complex protein Nup160-like [Syngnathus typhle]XP_061138236.1 nuclear pore complex protein Nup160-like [Syngnathus typhle]